MGTESHLTIVSVYPRLLGTYGDTGNALVLASRARRRGIGARIITVHPGTAVPVTADVYCLGGGEDTNQTLAALLLRADGGLRRAAARGATVLGVCAGLQLLGQSFTDSAGAARPALELLDVECGRLRERAVGEIVVDPSALPGVPALTGYENHRGDAVLRGSAQPLGTVRVGIGNGPSRTDGAVSGRIVGTYLHGPLLARNPALADHLLHGVVGTLEPLGTDTAERLHTERLDRVLSGRARSGPR